MKTENHTDIRRLNNKMINSAIGTFLLLWNKMLKSYYMTMSTWNNLAKKITALPNKYTALP